MSATQDEISWTVTFNILATAVFTPMTGWLVGRFGRGPVQFWSLVSFSAATLMCGLSQSLETLVFWRTVQGASGAPLLPLGPGHPARRLPSPPARVRHLDLRRRQHVRSHHRPRAGRLSCRELQLAVGLLHDPAGLDRGHDCLPLRHTAREARHRRPARLDGISRALGRHRLDAAAAFARAAARLVRVLRDPDRGAGRRGRPLRVRRAQRDRKAPVPEPAPRPGPQLRGRHVPDRHLRHAQLHAHGAAAAAAAEPAGLP